MTVGRRIAELRKQRGLSQEALGEALHVTRQSISKWESDSALPEIDKFVMMSRLFGVPVGVLLGVENGEGESAPAPEKGELTDAQLKMVEEIVSRYVKALREENDRCREAERFAERKTQQQQQQADEAKRETERVRGRKRRFGILAASFAAGIILSVFAHRLADLDSSYRGVQNSLVSLQSSVNNQISSLAGRVESILAEQNALAADHGESILAVDMENGTVTFSLYAVPKVYKEGMQVEFVAEYGDGKSATAQASEGENARFSGLVTCPLTDETGTILLSAAFYSDGERKTQPIGTYEWLYEATLPSVDVHSLSLFWKEAEAGRPIPLNGCQVMVRENGSMMKELPYKDGVPELASVRVGIFKNNVLAAWAQPYDGEPAQKGNSNGSGAAAAVPAMREGDLLFAFGDVSVTLERGDALTVAAVLTDRYGREFIQVDQNLVLSEAANELVWEVSTLAPPFDPKEFVY